MAANVDHDSAQREAAVLQAIANEYSMLQSARGATIAESSSRSSLYMTTLSGAVVALALVAQASQFGQTFFIFALAIMPVVFFLGIVTYYRLLQTGIEDVVYGRAIGKIREFYSQLDPAKAHFFHERSLDHVGLKQLGVFAIRWQQFLSAAAMIAMVNAVVGGVFVALTFSYLFNPRPWLAVVIGALGALLFGAAFLRHQWTAWQGVNVALPVTKAGS